MSRRPASVTQADVARAIRAAQQTGAAGVEIRDGTIFIRITPEIAPPAAAGVDDRPAVVM